MVSKSQIPSAGSNSRVSCRALSAIMLGLVLSYVGQACAGQPHSYIKIKDRVTPAQATWRVLPLCNAYNFPTNLKGGGVVGIIELGGGWVQSDLDLFSALNGIPKINVTNISVNGGQNSPGVAADAEVALDIQVIAGAYYYATGTMPTIKVFFAPNAFSSFEAVIQAAVANGCDVLSISWGTAESNWNPATAASLDAAALAAAKSGLVIFAASGDNSSNDSTSSTEVDCPASIPHIVGCGGTAKTNSSEIVWGDGNAADGGTGGGFSALFPVQSFQTGAPTPPNGLGRMVPDVAADADPNTGVLIVVGGQEIQVGGTSGVAPLYSGLFAAFGKKLGFVTPKLWSNQKAFVDITAGSNGAYSAAKGPDPCTGIGVPNGKSIATVFTSNVGPPALSGTGNLFYGVKHSPLPINTYVNVLDSYSSTLASATVSITNVVPAQDILSLVPTAAMGNITSAYNAGTGVLTLTSAGGTATLAQFQAALRAVSYSNSSSTPAKVPRTVTFQVSDGTLSSNLLTSTVTIGYYYVTATYNSATKTLTLADDPNDDAVAISLRGTVLTVSGGATTLIGTPSNSSNSVNFTYSGDMKVVCNFTGGNDSIAITGLSSSSTTINLGDGNDTATLTYCSFTNLAVDGGAGTNALSLVSTNVRNKTIKNIQIGNH